MIAILLESFFIGLSIGIGTYLLYHCIENKCYNFL